MHSELHAERHDAPDLAVRAEELLRQLKGVQDARVLIDARGRVARVFVVAGDKDTRAAARNVQSALMAALGLALPLGVLEFVPHIVREQDPVPVVSEPAAVALPGQAAVPVPQVPVPVLDLAAATARRSELNVAARVAFDTLRAAQTSFHGFQFDGAELVRINDQQYVVVAVRRATTEAHYCGAAPVIDSVGTASARALMNAVGAAAMGATPIEWHVDGEQYRSANA